MGVLRSIWRLRLQRPKRCRQTDVFFQPISPVGLGIGYPTANHVWRTSHRTSRRNPAFWESTLMWMMERAWFRFVRNCNWISTNPQSPANVLHQKRCRSEAETGVWTCMQLSEYKMFKCHEWLFMSTRFFMPTGWTRLWWHILALDTRAAKQAAKKGTSHGMTQLLNCVSSE